MVRFLISAVYWGSVFIRETVIMTWVVNGVALIRGTTVYGLGLVTMQFRSHGLVQGLYTFLGIFFPKFFKKRTVFPWIMGMKSICFSLNSPERYMFFQKNLLDNKSASPVIRTVSDINNPAFNDWDLTHHFNSVQFLFLHALDATKNMYTNPQKNTALQITFSS